MPDYPDYELHGPGAPLEPEPSRSQTAKWILIAVLVVAGVGAVWYAMSRRAAPVPVEQAAPVAAAEPPPAPLGAEPAAVEVPPLDESDIFVRDMVRQLSTHPVIGSWLATDGLIRNFTVVVSNVADGNTPAGQLTKLRPETPFVAADRGEQLTIDPRSYERYNRFADALASIDPDDAARLYGTLKPRIEEAYRDLGFPNTPFDRTLTRAIVTLLETPVVEGPIELQPAGAASFAYADPDLETLPGAQRQLLRMGPENVRKVRASLRALAIALGIPADQLPAAR
jgi:hypothetical protein